MAAHQPVQIVYLLGRPPRNIHVLGAPWSLYLSCPICIRIGPVVCPTPRVSSRPHNAQVKAMPKPRSGGSRLKISHATSGALQHSIAHQSPLHQPASLQGCGITPTTPLSRELPLSTQEEHEIDDCLKHENTAFEDGFHFHFSPQPTLLISPKCR